MALPQAKRILFVDDERDLVEMAKRKLERSGYQVNVAYNGQEGMDIARKENIDLIVTDVVMPVMDGFTFFKQLKEKKDTCDIPVMVLTARANMEDSFRSLGVNDFLVKPFDGQKLIDKIERIMTKSMGIKKQVSVLIAGNTIDITNEMSTLLLENGLEAEVIQSPLDLIKIACEKRPDIILLDILLEKYKSHELIKALKSFSQLADAKILTYIDFDPNESGHFKVVEEIRTIKSSCLAAGAYKHIGIYNRNSFLNSFQEFISNF